MFAYKKAGCSGIFKLISYVVTVHPLLVAIRMFAAESPAFLGYPVTVIVAVALAKSLKISTNPCVAKLQSDKSNDTTMFDDSNVWNTFDKTHC